MDILYEIKLMYASKAIGYLTYWKQIRLSAELKQKNFDDVIVWATDGWYKWNFDVTWWLLW